MPTFLIEFASARNDEKVEASHYVDKPPFVDFISYSEDEQRDVTVARYRADDIKRILRKEG